MMEEEGEGYDVSSGSSPLSFIRFLERCFVSVGSNTFLKVPKEQNEKQEVPADL